MIFTTAIKQTGIGVSILDCDHREMEEAFKELNAEIAAGSNRSQAGYLLRTLANFTILHFALEEGMMEATSYPMLNRHRTNHRHLMQRINSLVSSHDRDGRVQAGKTLGLLAWLSREHVEADDKYFGNWSNGL